MFSGSHELSQLDELAPTMEQLWCSKHGARMVKLPYMRRVQGNVFLVAELMNSADFQIACEGDVSKALALLNTQPACCRLGEGAMRRVYIKSGALSVV